MFYGRFLSDGIQAAGAEEAEAVPEEAAGALLAELLAEPEAVLSVSSAPSTADEAVCDA